MERRPYMHQAKIITSQDVVSGHSGETLTPSTSSKKNSKRARKAGEGNSQRMQPSVGGVPAEGAEAAAAPLGKMRATNASCPGAAATTMVLARGSVSDRAVRRTEGCGEGWRPFSRTMRRVSHVPSDWLLGSVEESTRVCGCGGLGESSKRLEGRGQAATVGVEAGAGSSDARGGTGDPGFEAEDCLLL